MLTLYLNEMYSILNKLSEYLLSIIKKTLLQRFFTFLKIVEWLQCILNTLKNIQKTK